MKETSSIAMALVTCMIFGGTALAEAPATTAAPAEVEIIHAEEPVEMEERHAFARMITATINLLKRRGDENNSLAAARCVSFCGALMSIQALQTALLGRYGSDAFAARMNTIVGLVIVFMMIGLCVVMLKNTDRMTMKKNDSR